MSDVREKELLKELQIRDQQVVQLKDELARITHENTILRRKIDALVRRIFGAKSEQLDSTELFAFLLDKPEEGPAQGEVSDLDASEALLPRPEKKTRQRGARTPRFPEGLPVVEEVIEPEPVKAFPQDWRRIGEETSNQLDFEPGRFFWRRTVRPTYVHRRELDVAPVTAPLPEKLQERGLAAPGLLAHIVVSKFCDHLPLYRQEYIFSSRHQVWLPRQTMCRWMELAADWLKPIYLAIREELMQGGYVQIDETVIRYLSPGHGQTRQGYLWAASAPGGDVVFYWNPSRSAACLKEIVPSAFSGIIQCDGYSAYDCFAKSHAEPIILAGCMAHLRRYFFEAREESPQIACWILRQIQLLYEVEKFLRESRCGPAFCEAVRAHRSRPIMARLHRLLVRLKVKKRYLPKSGMGEAIDYALGQWESVCVFLSDGRVQIDNNAVENSIRPTAVGKRNWLFIGEVGAGERSAILYSIVECCRRRGIDPYSYLRDVLTRLPSMKNSQIKDVTPAAWAKAQAQKSAALAA